MNHRWIAIFYSTGITTSSTVVILRPYLDSTIPDFFIHSYHINVPNAGFIRWHETATLHLYSQKSLYTPIKKLPKKKF